MCIYIYIYGERERGRERERERERESMYLCCVLGGEAGRALVHQPGLTDEIGSPNPH